MFILLPWKVLLLREKNLRTVPMKTVECDEKELVSDN